MVLLTFEIYLQGLPFSPMMIIQTQMLRHYLKYYLQLKIKLDKIIVTLMWFYSYITHKSQERKY